MLGNDNVHSTLWQLLMPGYDGENNDVETPVSQFEKSRLALFNKFHAAMLA
jgi:hypothetical protein